MFFLLVLVLTATAVSWLSCLQCKHRYVNISGDAHFDSCRSSLRKGIVRSKDGSRFCFWRASVLTSTETAPDCIPTSLSLSSPEPDFSFSSFLNVIHSDWNRSQFSNNVHLPDAKGALSYTYELFVILLKIICSVHLPIRWLLDLEGLLKFLNSLWILDIRPLVHSWKYVHTDSHPVSLSRHSDNYFLCCVDVLRFHIIPFFSS